MSNVLNIPLTNSNDQLLNAILEALGSGPMGQFIKSDGSVNFDNGATEQWTDGTVTVVVGPDRVTITDTGTGKVLTITADGIAVGGGDETLQLSATQDVNIAPGHDLAVTPGRNITESAGNNHDIQPGGDLNEAAVNNHNISPGGDLNISPGNGLNIDGNSAVTDDIIIPGIGTLHFVKGIYIGTT